MALILNIDTASDQASVCLADKGQSLGLVENPHQKEHAGWIHQAVSHLMNQAGKTLNEIQAVAITSGPGSYTGLRIGMATAKGLCYALKVPFITENTLRVMAAAVSRNKELISHPLSDLAFLVSPMMDARRLEVFAALYDLQLKEVLAPAAVILDEALFKDPLDKNAILFIGSGITKWKNICKHPNAFFSEITHNATELAWLAEIKFQNQDFTDLIYSEPVYLKEFYQK